MSKTIQPDHTMKTPDITVGLSACLAGQPVRYNGGHSQSRLCLNSLSPYFKFETFCPEVSAGFGTPRPTMRLVGDPQHPDLIHSDGGDSTPLNNQLIDGFKNKLEQFSELDGYILMKNSPSCGLERVKVYQDNGYPHKEKGQGIFARALQQKYPLLPLEEEGRLHDPHLLENFILRVYAHHRFRVTVLDQPEMSSLVRFHSLYKYLVMAHNQQSYRQLGRLVANADKKPVQSVIRLYFEQLMNALSVPARRSGHCNVLQHLLGYLKKSVNGSARQDIVSTILRYREGKLPLITPVTLLLHYIEQQETPNGDSSIDGSQSQRYPDGYLQSQYYWHPYPDDLGLRNHI
ncbi:YbgA family protein [Pseudomaricurvus sp.]|uniref:YbgA family protein n=1 Tax=Pseudomaricurvus sp. TaxID=2004510 RepID=UPI003F6B8248